MPGGITAFLLSVTRHYFGWMLAASLLAVTPLLAGLMSDPVSHVGGDSWVYLIWMRCFSEQLWQGDLYPRWCMDLNSGLGTPLFLTYFPLPFYFAALFHPLNLLGLDYYGLFVILCFVLSFLAVLSCFAWLRDVVSAPVALLAAMLYLYLPYHADMMLFRGVYTELCAAVWLPLFFKFLRRLCRDGEPCVPRLALVCGLLLLTQVMIAAQALAFGGLYMLLVTRGIGRWLRVLGSFGWGAGLAAFYLLPGHYFQQFLADYKTEDANYGWSNKFFGLHMLEAPDLQRPFAAAVATLVIFALCAMAALLARKRMQPLVLRHEAMVWLLLGCGAVFMMFTVSSPVYALIDRIAKLLYPWRMQMVITLSVCMIAAVSMQLKVASGTLRTWRMDYALLLVCLWLFSHYVTATFSPQGEALKERITKAKAACTLAERPRWVDLEHWECEYMAKRAQEKHAQAEIITGKGSASVTEWGWRALRISVGSGEMVTLRLNQVYFPVWRAWLDRSQMIEISPQDSTGQILVKVPAGKHEVLFTHSILHGAQWLVVADIISAVCWVGMAITLWRRRGNA